MESRFEQYSSEKLKKEIKFSGWLVAIFTLALVYLTYQILSDFIYGIDLSTTLIFVYIAMAAGMSPTYLKRRKMVSELKGRQANNSVESE